MEALKGWDIRRDVPSPWGKGLGEGYLQKIFLFLHKMMCFGAFLALL